MTSDAVRAFAYSLRQNLLSDNYGGWHNLDPQFLRDLCERISEEADEFIDHVSHKKCEFEKKELEKSLSDHKEEIEKLEQSLNDSEELRLKFKYSNSLSTIRL